MKNESPVNQQLKKYILLSLPLCAFILLMIFEGYNRASIFINTLAAIAIVAFFGLIFHYFINTKNDADQNRFLTGLKEKFRGIISSYKSRLEMLGGSANDELNSSVSLAEIQDNLRQCLQEVCDLLDTSFTTFTGNPITVHIKYFPELETRREKVITLVFPGQPYVLATESSSIRTLVMSNMSLNSNRRRLSMHPIKDNTAYNLIVSGKVDSFYCASIDQLNREYITTASYNGFKSQYVFPLRKSEKFEDRLLRKYVGFLVFDCSKPNMFSDELKISLDNFLRELNDVMFEYIELNFKKQLVYDRRFISDKFNSKFLTESPSNLFATFTASTEYYSNFKKPDKFEIIDSKAS